MITLLALLLLVTAEARPPDATLAGGDLVAWQDLALRQLEDAEAIVGYRAFIQNWPTSPLAEVAWSRLVALGAETGSWTLEPGVRPRVLADLRRSWRSHEEVLQRGQGLVAVAHITDEDTLAEAADAGRAERPMARGGPERREARAARRGSR